MDLTLPYLPTIFALAVVATVGYVFGRSSRREVQGQADQARRELKRAKAVARNLEMIVESIRVNLETHQSKTAKFKDRVRQLSGQEQEAAWKELLKEAEEMLRPTMQLTTQIAHAYDELRQQSNHLMTFTEVRTDPLTKVCNRRALDEHLLSTFALFARYKQPFALVIFDIDHFKKINDERGHLFGDRTLQEIAQLLDNSTRETDLVARFGGEEFVVVSPHTGLEGACVFAEKFRRAVTESFPFTISAGVAEARESDGPESLLSRADVALYRAKAAGRNCVYRHDGELVEAVQSDSAVAEPVGASAAIAK